MQYRYIILEYNLGNSCEYYLLRTLNNYLYYVFNAKSSSWHYSKKISKKMLEIKHHANNYTEIISNALVEIFEEYLNKNDVQSIKELYSNVKEHYLKRACQKEK